VRVPEEVVEQRQARIKADAKRRGQAQANPQALARAEWTLLITNGPRAKRTVSEVLILQRARWQIERLFRLWKQYGKIDEWKGRTRWSILCEVMPNRPPRRVPSPACSARIPHPSSVIPRTACNSVKPSLGLWTNDSGCQYRSSPFFERLSHRWNPLVGSSR